MVNVILIEKCFINLQLFLRLLFSYRIIELLFHQYNFYELYISYNNQWKRI